MRRLAALTVLSLVTQSAATIAHADDAGATALDPAPPGYHRESSDHRGLVYAGGGMLLGAWFAGGAAVGIGRWFDSDLDSPRVLWMALPIAGPFVELQYADKDIVKTLLVADGLVQMAGLGLAVLGYALPSSVVVRDRATAVRLAPVPIALGRDSAGVGVAGTF